MFYALLPTSTVSTVHLPLLVSVVTLVLSITSALLAFLLFQRDMSTSQEYRSLAPETVTLAQWQPTTAQAAKLLISKEILVRLPAQLVLWQ